MIMGDTRWLQELQAGDKVFVHTRYTTNVSIVGKITPSGLIKVGGVLYNQNGYQRGRDGHGRPWLTKWTQEKQNEFNVRVRRKKCIRTIRDLTDKDFETVDLQVLQEFVDRFKEKQ